MEKINVIVFRLEVGVHLPAYTLSSQTPRTYLIRVSLQSVSLYQAAYCHHNPCAHIRLHIVITFHVHISGCILSYSVCIYQAAYCHHIPCAYIRLHIVITIRMHISGCILSSYFVCTYQAAYCHHITCAYIRLKLSSLSVCTYQAAYCHHNPYAHIRLHIVITISMHISGCILSSQSVCTYQAAYCHHNPCPNVIASYNTHEEQKILITSFLLI